jgi:phospholipid-binding lipoprotein MlaA
MMKQTLIRIAALGTLLTLGACSSAPDKPISDYQEPVFSAARILPADVDERDVTEVYDPWEGLNKRVYNFNYHLDSKLLFPIIRGYEWIMPTVAQKGVHNFFENIVDMRTLVNSLLQLAPEKAAQSAGRVLVNSTVGLLGLFDVATTMGIPQPSEDFGQTLGRWGVGAGPYLVLPALGPSTLRDGIGLIPDLMLTAAIQENIITNDDANLGATALNLIDTRKTVPFRYYETGSAFEYETLRWLYMTKRELDIEK